MPLGVGAGRLLARTTAGLLNIDLTSLAAPGSVYVTVIAAGLAVPLLTAVAPLARGRGPRAGRRRRGGR